MASDPVIHVIDDDEAAREALAFLIDCAGYPVRTYESATRFLDHAADLEPGCIVTDVRMPEMSGIELIERLKETGMAAPVIVITGHADVPMAIQAMKQGVADFIEKPFSDEAIIGAIRAAVDRDRARSELAAESERFRRRMAALSPREREVLEGLVEDHPNKVIASDLDISARTVEVYRANVMAKMKAGSLSDLVRMATVARLTTQA
ncbi:response regulator FixJ [Sphingosinicella terrae]|uniref:response regulator FixJ n=1 Tax=Sphingosinicella terrae TaxID=2172047 RepID=UPI000E0DE350|nr:response regulator FixJ [Sphingosinicella terrae]